MDRKCSSRIIWSPSLWNHWETPNGKQIHVQNTWNNFWTKCGKLYPKRTKIIIFTCGQKWKRPGDQIGDQRNLRNVRDWVWMFSLQMAKTFQNRKFLTVLGTKVLYNKVHFTKWKSSWKHDISHQDIFIWSHWR